MKKIIAVILAAVLITTLFIACSKQTDTTNSATEVETDESGEAVTEVVTDASGETVTETVTEKVTKADGTVETVTKTVPVTKAVTQSSTTSKSNTTTKKSSGSSSGGSSSNTTTTKKTTTTKPATTKPTTTKPTTTKPTTTAHTHNWVTQTKTETTYEWEQHAICNGCGMDMSVEAQKLGISYGLFHMKHYRGDGVSECPKTLGNYSTYHYEQVKEATGTKTVITGYKCSTCGATKKP